MGATSGGGTVHSAEVRRRVLLVEEELYSLIRSNMTGATSGGGYVYSPKATRRELLVEEELSTRQK